MHAIEKARAMVPELDALPLPAGGDTLARWQALARIARADLSVARIAEGHADARAILSELGAEVPAGLLGVWAARPTDLRAEPVRGGWRLHGEKPWSSGSTALDAALVTAIAPDGPRLFLVAPQGLDIVPGSWTPRGMEATHSDTLVFSDVLLDEGAALGAPGAYVERPGFGHGGLGVGACWWGGADGVADALREAVRRADHRPSVPLALGQATVDLAASRALLHDAASRVDDAPRDRDLADHLAGVVRLGVERAARRVLDVTTQALGADSLCHRADHAGRVADLLVYLSQLDPHRSAVAIGEAHATEGARW